jgi:hypothetical protein
MKGRFESYSFGNLGYQYLKNCFCRKITSSGWSLFTLSRNDLFSNNLNKRGIKMVYVFYTLET